MSEQASFDIRSRIEAEREDPRNALLDSMARQIADAYAVAVQNDFLPQLLTRLERTAPAIAKTLADRAPAPPAPEMAPAAPIASPAPAATVLDPLEVTELLTTLKLTEQFRMSPERRALFDRSRAIVRRWAQAVRGPARIAREAPPRLALPDIAHVDDVGGGL